MYDRCYQNHDQNLYSILCLSSVFDFVVACFASSSTLVVMSTDA